MKLNLILQIVYNNSAKAFDSVPGVKTTTGPAKSPSNIDYVRGSSFYQKKETHQLTQLTQSEIQALKELANMGTTRERSRTLGDSSPIQIDDGLPEDALAKAEAPCK